MQINTPAHLIAYLEALCLAHPLVRQVITGEGSRGEAATLATAEYPHVRIETPDVTIPRSESQKTLSTRIYVLGKSSEKGDKEDDRIANEAYRIAEDIVSAMDTHTNDGVVDIALADGIEINPCVAMGSDQLLGWMFDLSIHVNRHLCRDNEFDTSAFMIPQFRWSNIPDAENNFVVSFQDLSIVPAGTVLTWFYQESVAQAIAAQFNPGDGILLALDENVDGVERILHVWLRIVKGDKQFWSYARILARESSGVSLPFIPFYPA